MEATAPVRVALAGNPNSGKTSLFNAITGARQRVGNYPGVTVERRTGRASWQGAEVEITDLPGVYGLHAWSPEERIAQEEVRQGGHDVVVVVADSLALERGLAFLRQVVAQGSRAVLCLNMADEADRAGQQVDLVALSQELGLPVVRTVGHRGEGVAELLEQVLRQAGLPAPQPAPAGSQGEDPALEEAREGARWAREVLRGSLLRPARPEARLLTDRLDAILAHRIAGPLIFAGVMYALFWLTFTLGEIPMGWLEALFAWLGTALGGLWPAGSDSLLRSLVVDGVIGGVGGVVVFVPNIFLLFLGLSLLEATGYMARVAFLVDRWLHGFGLHGKSLVPLITGFGCSVPGIMATRTLEDERDRLTTMLVLPLMSCGARLPIWMLLVPAFFPAAWRAPALWGLYAVGVFSALALARLLRSTVLAGHEAPFVLELPPYRLPALSSLLGRAWERSATYLRKAGTVILALSIVLWGLATFPRVEAHAVDAQLDSGALVLVPEDMGVVGTITPLQAERARATESMEHSLAGRLGKAMEPGLRPMGLDWRLGTAMVGAFAAKEVFVAQLGILHGMSEEDEGLIQALQRQYTPLQGLALALFLLMGTPCMATVAITRREANSSWWAALQFFGLTGLAWLVATATYQLGSLFL